MTPLADLFVHAYVLVDDALRSGAVPVPRLPAAVRRPVVVLRNRIETTTGEITVDLRLDRRGARTFWGLLARAAATILAHTLLRLGLA